MREYSRKNKDKINQAQKEMRIKRVYGITLAEFEILLKKQNGGCALCGRKQQKYRLAVDHDHKTRKVRGILCNHCNRGLGIFKDNVWLLHNAIKYLNFPPGVFLPEAKLLLDKSSK